LKVSEIGFNLQKNRWVKFENGDGSIIEDEECLLEPIPLTEEWLVRAGFSSSFSSDPQNFPASKKFELNGFKIHQPIEDVEQFIFEPIVDDCIELKSVHQLQNLTFALTGQELEFTPWDQKN